MANTIISDHLPRREEPEVRGVSLLHFLTWLKRPIRDRHTRLQWGQLKCEEPIFADREEACALLAELCPFHVSKYYLSQTPTPICRTLRHLLRLLETDSHASLQMPKSAMSRLQASENRNFGRPWCRLPVASSPYRIDLGSPSSDMHCIWPSQRRRRCLMAESRVGILHTWRTFSLLILSRHVTPISLRKHRKWNVFSFISCLRYVVQDSEPYSRELSTHVLYMATLVLNVSLLLDHARFDSRPKAVAALPSRTSISTSREQDAAIVEPR